MANTDEHSGRVRGPVRIDGQTTLSFALVLILIGGAMQYGRQSERLDSVQRELEKVTQRLEKLAEAVQQLSKKSPGGDP